MSQPDETTVSFRLTGDLLDPAAITEATGITPKASHRAGDLRPDTKRGTLPPWTSGLWRISSEPGVSQTATLEEHLVHLLDRLEPVREPLLALAAEQQLEVDFFCGYFMHRGNSWWELTPRTLARVARLDARLGFDVYGQ